LDNVAHIRQPVTAQLSPVIFDDDEGSAEGIPQGWGENNVTSTRAANEWGVNLIGTPAVWAKGNRGQGIVVGILDTGAIHTHDDLKGNWRSTYGWFDPTDKSRTPIDTNGHGTHVAGSAVGQNGIGVAPGATWIACRGCTTAKCPEAALIGCAQWMLCPTDVTGKNPKCELAPHVINNSWGSEVNSNTYQAVVNAWRTAGIIPVFANGNSGPNCGTANSPGDYKNVIGVGAVGVDDKLASLLGKRSEFQHLPSRRKRMAHGWHYPPDYKTVIGVGNLGIDDKLSSTSSRGPAADGRIKPDVSAPGNRVRSAWNTGNSAYNTISGTSMASPHVAGAIALYLSANKGAKYDQVYKAFTTTVDTKTLTPSNQNCGGVSDSKYPNNNYGFGRINVARATGGGARPPSPSKARTAAVSTSRPFPSSPLAMCNGCIGCYSPLISYCFPSEYSNAQCAAFTDLKTVWCGKI
ncbi:hypothetical protein AaE_009441, partial [Aphanomyces astaci]